MAPVSLRNLPDYFSIFTYIVYEISREPLNSNLLGSITKIVHHKSNHIPKRSKVYEKSGKMEDSVKFGDILSARSDFAIPHPKGNSWEMMFLPIFQIS